VNKTSVDALITGILSAAEVSRSSIKQIKDLELVSRRIDKIVDAITTVSIQTNMLAVNGSIEAARAGEFGKGFVVVATDIRNLAHDSAENADRIKDMVKGVQDQIGIVGRDLDEILSTSMAEVEKAKATTINLVSIETDIAAVEEGCAGILAASNEIAAAIGQVKKGGRSCCRFQTAVPGRRGTRGVHRGNRLPRRRTPERLRGNHGKRNQSPARGKPGDRG